MGIPIRGGQESTERKKNRRNESIRHIRDCHYGSFESRRSKQRRLWKNAEKKRIYDDNAEYARLKRSDSIQLPLRSRLFSSNPNRSAQLCNIIRTTRGTSIATTKTRSEKI